MSFGDCKPKNYRLESNKRLLNALNSATFGRLGVGVKKEIRKARSVSIDADHPVVIRVENSSNSLNESSVTVASAEKSPGLTIESETLMNVTKSLNDLTAVVGEKYNFLQASIESERQQIRAENQLLTEMVKSLNEKLSVVSDEKCSPNAQLIASDLENKRLLDVEREKRDLEKRLALIESENREIRAENERLVDKTKLFDNRMIVASDEKRSLHAEIVYLKRSLDELANFALEFFSENEQLTKCKAELEDQLRSAEKYLEDVKIDVSETKTNLRSLTESHDALCERVQIQTLKDISQEIDDEELFAKVMEDYVALLSHNNPKQKIRYFFKVKDIVIKYRKENLQLRKETTMLKCRNKSLQDRLDKFHGKRRFDPKLAFCFQQNASSTT